jgi:hypothetical protein
MYAAFLNLGYQEIFLILIVAVLLFGGRLPEVSRNVGRWFFDLKKGMNDLNRDIYSPTPPEPPPPPPAGPDSRSVPRREDRLLLDAEVAPDDPYVLDDADTASVQAEPAGEEEKGAGSSDVAESEKEESEKKEAGQKEAGSGD